MQVFKGAFFALSLMLLVAAIGFWLYHKVLFVETLTRAVVGS